MRIYVVPPSRAPQAIEIAVDEPKCVHELDTHNAASGSGHGSPDGKWNIFVGIGPVDCAEGKGGEEAVCTAGLAHFDGRDVAIGGDSRGAVEGEEGAGADEGDVAVAAVIELDGHGVGRHLEGVWMGLTVKRRSALMQWMR
jgi:hypothetical protein